MGGNENWKQVFGKNPLLWPFPFFGDSGKPVGDGVIWPRPAVPVTEPQPNDETMRL